MLAQTLGYIKSKINQNVLFSLSDFERPLLIMGCVKNLEKTTNQVQVEFNLNGGRKYVAWYPIENMQLNRDTSVTTVKLKNSGLQITKIPHVET